MAQSTKKTYKRAFCLLSEFVNITFPGTKVLPTSTAILANFIAHLFSKGYASATITTYTAAITTLHKLADLPNPAESFLVKKLLKGAEEIKGQNDRRLPMTNPILRRVIEAIPFVTPISFDQKLFKAMFLVAFHAFLRVGEITVRSPADLGMNVLQLQNVKFRKQGGCLVAMEITIVQWKARGSAPPCKINIPCSNTLAACPVASMASFVTARGVKAGPLFLSEKGRPVTRGSFSEVLKKALHSIGIKEHYTSHSFRIGAATNAALLGFPNAEIQRLGRWKSDAYKKYVRINTFQSM